MKANNTRSEAAGSSRIYGLFSRFHESRCLWDLHCPSPQLIIGLFAMKDPCSELPNTSAGGATRCVPSLPQEEKPSPRGQFRHGALKQTIPAPGQCPSGAVGFAARSREGRVPQPPALRLPGGPGGAGRCAAAPAPCPTQPGRPSAPRHKAHCPYSFGLCSHMANPCRHSQHPFIQAHNVPQQGTIGTLFASIIDANGRQRERERKKII